MSFRSPQTGHGNLISRRAEETTKRPLQSNNTQSAIKFIHCLFSRALFKVLGSRARGAGTIVALAAHWETRDDAWHNPSDHSDPVVDRRGAELGLQPRLGIRAER